MIDSVENTLRSTAAFHLSLLSSSIIVTSSTFFIHRLVGRLSSFPPCFYIFAFQLNGEPSLPFITPSNKKKKDSLMCDERSMPALQKTMPAFLPWHERERGRERTKERNGEIESSLYVQWEFLDLKKERCPPPVLEKQALMWWDQQQHRVLLKFSSWYTPSIPFYPSKYYMYTSKW